MSKYFVADTVKHSVNMYKDVSSHNIIYCQVINISNEMVI